MCYSSAASAASFFTELVVCTILFLLPEKICGRKAYTKYDNWVFSFVILGISTMQVAEWIIHLDPDCGEQNITGAQFGLLSLLVLQPAFSLVGMTMFGQQRAVAGINVLPLLWLALMTAYAAGAASAMDDGLKLYYSSTLDQNVSQWCTVDKSCEDDMCDLNWNWDVINLDWRFWFYWGVVLILPVASLKNWLLWAILLSAHAIWSFSLGVKPGNVISSASASCFWGPLAALSIQLSTLPGVVQRYCCDRRGRTNRDDYKLI